MSEQRTLADLGVLVRRAREATGLGRRLMVERGIGPSSPTTWEAVELGKQAQTLTYTGIEKALDWPAGSMLAYLDGGPEPGQVAAVARSAAEEVPRLDEATYDQLHEAIGRLGVRLPPRIDVAPFDALLDEVRRRHEADRAELARRLYPVLNETETAESVRARGMIPGRRLQSDSERQGDADEPRGQVGEP